MESADWPVCHTDFDAHSLTLSAPCRQWQKHRVQSTWYLVLGRRSDDPDSHGQVLFPADIAGLTYAAFTLDLTQWLPRLAVDILLSHNTRP